MYGNGQAPIFILKDGTQRTRGRSAQSNNIAAAKAVADAVRSTLGPKGMDKMLVDSMGDVVITNDGASKFNKTRWVVGGILFSRKVKLRKIVLSQSAPT